MYRTIVKITMLQSVDILSFWEQVIDNFKNIL